MFGTAPLFSRLRIHPLVSYAFVPTYMFGTLALKLGLSLVILCPFAQGVLPWIIQTLSDAEPFTKRWRHSLI